MYFKMDSQAAISFMVLILYLLWLTGANGQCDRALRNPYDECVNSPSYSCYNKTVAVIETMASACAKCETGAVASAHKEMVQIGTIAECVYYGAMEPTNLDALTREFNSIESTCFVGCRFQLKIFPAWFYTFSMPNMTGWFTDWKTFATDCESFFNPLLNQAAGLSLFEVLLLVMMLISPWIPLVHLFLINVTSAIIVLALLQVGLPLWILWVIIITELYVPGTAVACCVIGITWAIVTIKQRKPEAIVKQLSKTAIFFIAFGAMVEVSHRWYYHDPRFLWGGILFFFIYAIVITLNRRTVELEFTITEWQGGVAGTKSRPHKISLEKDFPFTLLRPLNRVVCWWNGVPWAHAAKALTGYFGEKEAVDVVQGATQVQQPVDPNYGKGKEILDKMAASSSSRGAGPEIPYTYSSEVDPADAKRWDDIKTEWITESGAPIHWNRAQEGKGKNKKGRGMMKTSLKKVTTSNFRKVSKPFWMSDPEVDQVARWDGDDWVLVPVDEWDSVDGYIMTSDVNGDVIQQVYYNPDEPFANLEIMDDTTANMHDLSRADMGRGETYKRIKNGQSVRMTRITYKKRPQESAAPAPASQPVPQPAAQPAPQAGSDPETKKALTSIVHLLEGMNLRILQLENQEKPVKPEANGTVDKLAVQPASTYSNPVDAVKPNGCFHFGCDHPSTMEPCNTDCGLKTCVHNTKCKKIVAESDVVSQAEIQKLQEEIADLMKLQKLRKQKADLLKNDVVKKEMKEEKKNEESKVLGSHLAEYPPDLLGAVVTVATTENEAYGIYTTKGVLTNTHTIGRSKEAYISPPHSPGLKTIVKLTESNVVSYKGHSELVLIRTTVDNCKPVQPTVFAVAEEILKDGPQDGVVVNATSSAIGKVSKRLADPSEVDIAATTKKGMCGSPYVVKQKVIALHCWGNCNDANNSGIAITKAVKDWLGGLPKN